VEIRIDLDAAAAKLSNRLEGRPDLELPVGDDVAADGPRRHGKRVGSVVEG
jgi:hypothetical protein